MNILGNNIDKVGVDKLLHLVISFAIVVVVVAIAHNWMSVGDAMPIGFIVALMAGISKELYDMFVLKSAFDPWDFNADLAGIAMAIFAMLVAL